MKPCRVFLILLVMILCIGVISVCVYATSSEPTGYSLPEAVPPIASTEGVSNDRPASEENNNGFPFLTVTEPHQGQEAESPAEADSETDLAPTNTTEIIEANRPESGNQDDPANTQPGSRAESQPTNEATKDQPDAQAAQDAEEETKSNDGLHFRIVKTAEDQEEVIADFSSWGLAILAAIWLLATIVLFAAAIILVMRLMRK